MHQLHAAVPDLGDGSNPRHVDPLVGRTFNGRFRIEARLAKGGMGKVYRAVQVPLGRCVALKVLNVGLTQENTADFHRRFFLEAATAARLNHPNTVTIFDYGCSDDGIYYIAMEHLEGPSLRQVLGGYVPMAPHRAVAIAIQIARSVRQAHALGFMHRDLKPANVILLHDDDGRDFAKVLDFGLAKSAHSQNDLTRTGQFLGSPGYMAPEQIRGHALDRRCDVYALGALLFEMLTGQTPFPRPGPMETLMAHVHEPVPTFAGACPHLNLPADLEATVRACLSKCPDDRPADMSTLMTRLRQAIPHLPALTGTPRLLHEYEASGWAVVSPTGALHQKPGSTKHGAMQAAKHAALTQYAPATQYAPTNGVLALLPSWPTNVLPWPDGEADPHAKTAGLEAPPQPSNQVEQTHRARNRHWGLKVGLLACLNALTDGPVNERPAQPMVLHLRSQPAGAKVCLGDTLVCPSTPCDIEWQPHAQQRAICLQFLADGYDAYFTTRKLQTSEQTIVAKLTCVPKLGGY